MLPADVRPPLKPGQVRALKAAGKILTQVLDELSEKLKPGVNALALDAFANKRIIDLGGESAFTGFEGYVHTLCVSVNDAVIHGVPTLERLRAGDIVSLDLGVRVNKMHADAARTYTIGSRPSKESRWLKSGVEAALAAALGRMSVNVTTEEIAGVIESTLQARGLHPVAEMAGHGVGLHLHEDPILPNVRDITRPVRLQAGRAYAIEPIALAEPSGLYIDARDGWTVRTRNRVRAAHAEATVLLTKQGVEIIAF